MDKPGEVKFRQNRQGNLTEQVSEIDRIAYIIVTEEIGGELTEQVR